MCRDSFMCITPRYMDTEDAATLNISCFTCGREPETNDVFADQTLMSCEKYEHGVMCITHSRTTSSYLKHLNFPLRGKWTQKYTISQICGKTILLQPEKYHALCKGRASKRVAFFSASCQVITSECNNSS